MKRAPFAPVCKFQKNPNLALIAIATASFWVTSMDAFAYNCTIKEGRYGYNVIATVKKGLVYIGQYGTTVLGRFDYDRKTIYEGRYSYQVFGRRDGNILYEGNYTYKVLGRFENCEESDFEN
jgi:hypothetical protein